MLIYQRLHQNASLASAVSMFLSQMTSLSTSKRVQEKTLSARTGGFSCARQRFPVAVAEQVADHIFQSLLPAAAALPGRRVFLVDGTSAPILKRTSDNGRSRSSWMSCVAAEMILKELAIGSVTYNLVGQVRRLAAERGKIAPRRISFTGVWSLMMPMITDHREKSME